ncbi:Protein of unknown function [Pyronema omphalodes CBS 100304]|uniref:Uncharacterized protein n=1 Tax=Pyronema omphalodes (strain CBS 100304) TaxID=1076935 RepID=U4L757_PYROM|nr:Protein of unknown function [Pyronema omphalodes CBS 100304]
MLNKGEGIERQITPCRPRSRRLSRVGYFRFPKISPLISTQTKCRLYQFKETRNNCEEKSALKQGYLERKIPPLKNMARLEPGLAGHAPSMVV